MNINVVPVYDSDPNTLFLRRNDGAIRGQLSIRECDFKPLLQIPPQRLNIFERSVTVEAQSTFRVGVVEIRE